MNLITHKEAARRMQRNEKLLRAKDSNGNWLFFPDLVRKQEAPGCTIWLSEDQVDAWVEVENRVFASAVIASPMTETEAIAGRGWHRLAQALM